MSLADAHPEPWKAEKAPDLSPDLLALCAAYDRLRAAQRVVDEHRPPYAGPDWAAKTQAYGEAKDQLARLFDEIRGGGR